MQAASPPRTQAAGVPFLTLGLSGSLSPRDGAWRPQVEDGGTASNMEGSCEYILNNSRGQQTRGDPPARRLG